MTDVKERAVDINIPAYLCDLIGCEINHETYTIGMHKNDTNTARKARHNHRSWMSINVECI
jgi:hypothetical protein